MAAGFLPAFFPKSVDGKSTDTLAGLNSDHFTQDNQSFTDIMQGMDSACMLLPVAQVQPQLLLNKPVAEAWGENLSLQAEPQADGKLLPQTGGGGETLPPFYPLMPAEMPADPAVSARQVETSPLGATRLAMAGDMPVSAEGTDAPQQQVNGESATAGKPVAVTMPFQTQDGKADSKQAQGQQSASGHTSVADHLNANKQGPASEALTFAGTGAQQGESQSFQQQQGQGRSQKEQVITSQLLAMERQAAQVVEQDFSLTSKAADSRPVQLEISSAVGSQGWDKAFQQHIVWMAGKHLQSAKIHLNPQALGPIAVELSMQEEHGSVTFHARHDTTREAIEAALPRLRMMFESQGLQLTNAQVSDSGFDMREQSQQAFHQQYGDSQQHNEGKGTEMEEELVTRIQTPLKVADGLLDDYV